MPALTPATLTFRDDAPYSTIYGDIYSSAAGGLAETRHVFIDGNNLAARFGACRTFTIVETGFGAGLNFLATWRAFKQNAPSDARLHFVSVEKHPFRADDLRRVLEAHASLAPLSERLLESYPPLVAGFHRLELEPGRVSLLLLFGDAHPQLTELDARADAFFLDGFAPSKNPEMWSAELFRELERLAAPGATLATYSVAGHVRDGLTAAGFSVQKAPGFGPKREMLVGRYRGEWTPASQRQRRVLIVGAGIAGTYCALALAREGLHVEIVEAASSPAGAASANPAGLVRPFLSLERGGRGEFTLSAYFHAVRHYQALAAAHPAIWQRTGVLQLARDAAHADKLIRALEALALPREVARWVPTEEGARLCGVAVSGPGLWFEGAGLLSGPQACAAALNEGGDRVRLHYDTQVTRIECGAREVRLFDARGTVIATGDEVILANGHQAAALIDTDLSLRPVRGQISLLPARGAGPLAAVCQEGYVMPAIDGMHFVGATFDEGDDDLRLRDVDHQLNLARAQRMLPDAFGAMPTGAIAGWVGLRCVSRDRRPLLGPLAPGLHACLALGSRGFTWAPLGAEIVVSALAGIPLPVPRRVARTLSPGRLAKLQPQ